MIVPIKQKYEEFHYDLQGTIQQIYLKYYCRVRENSKTIYSSNYKRKHKIKECWAVNCKWEKNADYTVL